MWAYPVQVLKSYNIAFVRQNTTTAIDGWTILRRVIYSPDAVTRVYAGPDFIVREKLFVPLDEPGAIITYEVESPGPVDIEIRFVPVLNLMWPGSLGGQETLWSSSDSAYVLSEPTHRFTASIGSPDTVAHDETANVRQHIERFPGMAFTVRAGGEHPTARVVIAGGGPGQDPTVTAKNLLDTDASVKKGSVDHYSDLLGHALQVETPDEDVNRALAWSEVALDQAWVCNPDLGCGMVAGYGPSRKARRPQYDWFFAGDGMVAIRGLLAEGQYDEARRELEFILKYQNQKTGMVWHELSQSAGLIAWDKYPYMFVHVDLTFDFLNTVAAYYSVTGDRNFLDAHWAAIQSAYEYCRSLLDPKDGLPRIPVDKEGAREQDSFSDELSLSADWVSASLSFSKLAAATGRGQAAEEARTASENANKAVAQRYWNGKEWITGYTRSGAAVIHHDAGASQFLGESILSETQRDTLLDRYASADFQSDWGTRGRAANTKLYEPASYANGSVWATATSDSAILFWDQHRPATALPIWRALVPWTSLDSLGHMHEALAGDYYHEQVESVPEQTWSSASFLTAAVQGLLGLQVDGASNRLLFAPHLPAEWNGVTIRNVHLRGSNIGLKMDQSATGIRLELHNAGPPVEMVFDPEIPLGAKLRGARLENRPIAGTIEQHPQDTHVKAGFTLPHGSSTLTIDYSGGVSLTTAPPHIQLGDASSAIKVTGVGLRENVYNVDFDYIPSAHNTFDLRTPWKIERAQGATFDTIAPGLYRFTVTPNTAEKESSAYKHGKVTVTFGH